MSIHRLEYEQMIKDKTRKDLEPIVFPAKESHYSWISDHHVIKKLEDEANKNNEYLPRIDFLSDFQILLDCACNEDRYHHYNHYNHPYRHYYYVEWVLLVYC